MRMNRKPCSLGILLLLSMVQPVEIASGAASEPICPAQTTDPSTLSLWRFDDAPPLSSTSPDSSGHGNTLRLQNHATILSGALFLDGVDDYAYAFDSPSLSPRASLTIDACITPLRTNGVIAAHYGRAPPGWEASWYLYLLGNGHLRFYVSGDGTNGAGVDIVGTLQLGSTYAVRAQYDGDARTLAVFLNDQLQAVTVPAWSTSIPSQLFDSSFPVDVGTLRNGDGSLGPFFAGTIDEVRIQGTTGLVPKPQAAPTRLRATDRMASALTLRWDGVGGPASPELPQLRASSYNPVIDVGPWGSWEDLYAYLPRIVTDWNGVPKLDALGRYQMMYTGGQCQPYPDCSSGSIDQGGLATSPDGTNWTKHGNEPVFPVRPGMFDASDAPPVTVIWDPDLGKYRMWHEGSKLGDPTWDDNIRVGYAESTDLVNWTNRQLVVGPTAGCFDWDDVLAPIVVKDPTAPANEQYKMWYTGHGYDPYALGYATSPDGIVWAKYSCSPIFSEPESVNPTQILRDANGVWWMYYLHYRPLDVRMARSEDGIQWEPLNGVIFSPDPAQAWQANSVYWHSFIGFGDQWRVFFNGGDLGSPSKGRIGFGEVDYTRLDHYGVERRTGTGPFTTLGSSVDPSIRDDSVSPGQVYGYRVHVVDASGAAGAWSAQLTVST